MELSTLLPIPDHMLVTFADEGVVEFVDYEGKKHTYTPDLTKGYFRFDLAYAFPYSVTAYGIGMHPKVIGSSWRSIIGQNVNYEHQVHDYHNVPGQPNYVEDRILGSVANASFPNEPTGGWRVLNGLKDDEVPHISGVASFAKQARAMGKVIGDHTTGRRRHTVSMEVLFPFEESGFVVAGVPGIKMNSSTPDDLAKAGYEYWDHKDAPDELLATFNADKKRITKQYRRRRTCLLAGGINNRVHFAGVGLVKIGAEPPAKITRLAASGAEAFTQTITQLPELLRQAYQQIKSK